MMKCTEQTKSLQGVADMYKLNKDAYRKGVMLP